MAFERIPRRQSEQNHRRHDARRTRQQHSGMESMPSEQRPRTTGQRRRDDGELVGERVSVKWLTERSDQERRRTSGSEQNAALAPCRLQSEGDDQKAEAHTDERRGHHPRVGCAMRSQLADRVVDRVVRSLLNRCRDEKPADQEHRSCAGRQHHPPRGRLHCQILRGVPALQHLGPAEAHRCPAASSLCYRRVRRMK